MHEADVTQDLCHLKPPASPQASVFALPPA
jgi:hypothetical protein